jgi:hypothetical protein
MEDYICNSESIELDMDQLCHVLYKAYGIDEEGVGRLAEIAIKITPAYNNDVPENPGYRREDILRGVLALAALTYSNAK